MRRRPLLVGTLAGILLVLGTAAVLTVTDRGAGAILPFGNDGVRAPEGVRIKVEVLNATRTRGLARRATMYLRDRGFDVVEIGTSSEQRDSTLVLDRSGNADWARLVADALGTGAVEPRPDTSRYLDVTVLIGADWSPPAEPFHP